MLLEEFSSVWTLEELAGDSSEEEAGAASEELLGCVAIEELNAW